MKERIIKILASYNCYSDYMKALYIRDLLNVLTELEILNVITPEEYREIEVIIFSYVDENNLHIELCKLMAEDNI